MSTALVTVLVIVIVVVLLLVGVAVVMNRTVFGRRIFAIGSNEATARLCGIRVRWTQIAIYSLAGALFGLAGALQFSRLTQGDPTGGPDLVRGIYPTMATITAEGFTALERDEIAERFRLLLETMDGGMAS